MKLLLLTIVCLCMMPAIMAENETNETNCTNITNATNITDNTTCGRVLIPPAYIPPGYESGDFVGYGHAIPEGYEEYQKEMERIRQQDYAEEVQSFVNSLNALTLEKLKTIDESEREWYHTNALVYGYNGTAKIFESRESLNAYIDVISPAPPSPAPEPEISWLSKLKTKLLDFWNILR